MRTMNMAIVGLGNMGNTHRMIITGAGEWYDVPIGGAIENLNLMGSFDIREERQQFARDNGLRAYASLEELLADPDIDFITCATPNDVHKEVAMQAMRAGKGVVCEKPITLSSCDLQEMIDVSVETGSLLTAHQNRRWDDDYATIRKIIADGLLGEVFRIESRVPNASGGPGGWRAKPEHGGGYLLDWGVHILDQALYMIPGKVRRVYARLTNLIQQEVDDGFYVELEFENGLVYYLEGGTSSFIELPRWNILGVNGTAVIDDFHVNGRMVRVAERSRRNPQEVQLACGGTRSFAVRRGFPNVTEPIPVARADVRDFYRNVAAACAGEAELIVKPEQIMRVMKLMEAVRESSKAKSSILFEE